MNNATEQIKERINVADVVGEYIKLEKAGTNYKALCPFHNEKTPSFMVNPERNFWYCFGCQKGGDVFSFLMEMEGVEFREALERLAERTGVELPRFDPAQQQDVSKKKKLYAILELANKFYRHQLANSVGGKKIFEYLGKRNVSKELAGKFQLGYAPGGWTNLLDFLQKRDCKKAEIELTGLLVAKADSKSGAYDRFRSRIMFPIRDVNGRTVGFSARVAPGGDEKSAKYINTPETEIYDKSSILYGLFEGKASIKAADSVVVVEGNVDVIASHSAGVENVVAISGTALTEQQVRLIRRYTQNIKLCFDMDEAGQNATAKSIAICLRNGTDVEVISLPEQHKDVGDLVEQDATKWKQIAEAGVPVMEFIFKRAMRGYDENDIRTKKIVAKELLNTIKDIADPIEQSYWIKKLSNSLDVDEEILTKILEKVNLNKDQREIRGAGGEKNGVETHKTRRQILEEQLLGLFSLYSAELGRAAKELEYDFQGDKQDLWSALREGKEVQSLKVEEYAMRVKYIKDENQGLIENELDPLKEWQAIVEELKKISVLDKINSLRKDIKRARDEGDETAVDLMTEELAKILQQRTE
jgi:DNA primase